MGLTQGLKDEQIIRILSTPTLIQGSQSQENERRMRIQDVKREISAECHDMYGQLQGEFGRIQSSFTNQQRKIMQLIQSRQIECTMSHAELACRINHIDDQRGILKEDFLLIKNDVNSECVNTDSKENSPTIYL